MSALAPSLIRIQEKQAPEGQDRKAFNRLRKKIESLQKEKERTSRDLDTCLQFYCEKILPDNKALVSSLVERVTISYPFYRTPKKMSKVELNIFREFLLDDIDMIFSMTDFSAIPIEIKEIYKTLSGVDYKEVASKELGHMKDEMEEMFRDAGINIDLSGIDLNDPQEEMLQKVFQSLGDAMSDDEESFREIWEKKKSPQKKSQIAFEELQKKSLSNIYKQLVKAFHPDLEQDQQKKHRKEELMKQVTCAYEKSDLYALLAIEMEWMAPPSDKNQLQSGKPLKVYNTILKDQVKILQDEIDMLILHPKYVPIQRFYDDRFNGIFVLKRAYEGLKTAVRELQMFVNRLRTSEVEAVLKTVINNELSSR